MLLSPSCWLLLLGVCEQQGWSHLIGISPGQGQHRFLPFPGSQDPPGTSTSLLPRVVPSAPALQDKAGAQEVHWFFCFRPRTGSPCRSS